MNNNKLGRGLAAFLDSDQYLKQSNNTEIRNIAIDSVAPNPFQPRKEFNEESLIQLAESIKSKGVLQPIIVREKEPENYELVAGERRLKASTLAGFETIPAIIVNLDPRDQLEIAIIENIQRENLNPIEEASSYSRLIKEFSYTQEELSKVLGKSRSHVTNILRLLSLPKEVRNLVAQGKLSFGHARALIGLENPLEIAQKIVERSLSVRETENLIKSLKLSDESDVISFEKAKKNLKYQDPDIANVISQISSILNMNVSIKLKKLGGTIEINFKNFEELDKFLQKINSVHIENNSK